MSPVIVALLASSGCGVVSRVRGTDYDSVAARRAVVASGLTSDTPPGFVTEFAGAVPAGNGGPALVPVPGQGSGVGTLRDGNGGVGVTDEELFVFYVERMLQNNMNRVYAYCTGPGPEFAEEIFSRVVRGWGGAGKSRYAVFVEWAGSPTLGWHLTQEGLTDRSVEEFDGRYIEFRCRFVPDAPIFVLAKKYGYTVKPIKGDRWDPNIAARPTTIPIPFRPT